jgi:DNA-binding CsgD family transcriptional regulator
MPGSPPQPSLDIPVEPHYRRIREAIRALVEMVAGPPGTNACLAASSDMQDEILVDTQVDGARYLLVRMPKLNKHRVQLSPREHEIVRMVAKGHPNKVIADVLNISSWTVCTHLRRIFAKMGVASRAAMVAQLIESGSMPKEPKLPIPAKPASSALTTQVPREARRPAGCSR